MSTGNCKTCNYLANNVPGHKEDCKSDIDNTSEPVVAAAFERHYCHLVIRCPCIMFPHYYRRGEVSTTGNSGSAFIKFKGPLNIAHIISQNSKLG